MAPAQEAPPPPSSVGWRRPSQQRLRALAAAALAVLLAHRMAQDVRDGGGGGAGRCQTTYLWEGYQAAPLPGCLQQAFPTYRLFKFDDRDPRTAQGARAPPRSAGSSPLRPAPARADHPAPVFAERRTLEQEGGRVSVLFVHGHMGSYQQMRSAASESGRELVRRLRAQGARVWLDWFAADFAAEPSALEPALMVRRRQRHAPAAQLSPPPSKHFIAPVCRRARPCLSKLA